MIIGFVIITAKPGRRDEVLREYREVTPKVLEEKGCIEYIAATDFPYGPPQSPLGDNTLVIVEKWESRGDLDAHSASEHMRICRSKVSDMVVTRTIHLLSPA